MTHAIGTVFIDTILIPLRMETRFMRPWETSMLTVVSWTIAGKFEIPFIQ